MNSDNIKRAADLCLNSYSTTVLPEGYDCRHMITIGTDDVYLFTNSEETWLIIRGTEWTVKEWWHDLTFFKHRVPRMGRVHKGFFKNIPNLWKSLCSCHEFSSRNIKIAGHSRGGALAQLLALKHKLKFKSDPRVYTFGSPRVGNREWVKAYGNIRTVRLSHWLDPVSKMPSLNYWHTPKLWMLKSLRRKHSMVGYFMSVQDDV